MKKLLLAAALLLAIAAPARAQQSTCPYIVPSTPGNPVVLTAGQWNFCFQEKQDALGYVPVNSANGVFTGRTVFAPSQTTFSSINVPVGAAPASPVAGDMWSTSVGLFYYNGTTAIGPLAGTGANTFTGSQVIDLGSGARPAANSGAAWLAYALDATLVRYEATAFGSMGVFDSRASLGTRALPTTVTSGTQLGSFEGKGYDGSVWSGTGAAFHPFAEGTWNSGSHPGKGCIATTATSSTTTTDNFCVHQDGGATLGTSATDQGAFTLNLQGSLYNNGTAPSGTGAYVRATAPTLGSPILTTPTITNPVLTPQSIATILAITCNSGSKGTLAFVSDTTGSATPTYHLTLAGSGATTVNSLVSCNGTNWVYD